MAEVTRKQASSGIATRRLAMWQDLEKSTRRRSVPYTQLAPPSRKPSSSSALLLTPKMMEMAPVTMAVRCPFATLGSSAAGRCDTDGGACWLPAAGGASCCCCGGSWPSVALHSSSPRLSVGVWGWGLSRLLPLPCRRAAAIGAALLLPTALPLMLVGAVVRQGAPTGETRVEAIAGLSQRLYGVCRMPYRRCKCCWLDGYASIALSVKLSSRQLSHFKQEEEPCTCTRLG